MPDWLSNGALPVGMLFMLVTVLKVVRRKAGNVVARAQYPGLASKLGLSFTPAPYKNGVGRLSGQYKGFRVIVDPDDQRRIFIAFLSSPAVELHNFVHNKRSRAQQSSFRPIDKVLSKLFKTCHASGPLVRALNEAEGLGEALKPLFFVRELKTLSVTAGGVNAVFDFGSPPYIPAELVDDVLPRLLKLASVFESPPSDVV
jgi:hypothetical protein